MNTRGFSYCRRLAVILLLTGLFGWPLAGQAQEVGPPAPGGTTINIKPYSGVEVTGDTEICEGGETVLEVKGDFETYTWSNGSTQRSIRVKEAGVYEVTVTTKGGCSLTSSVNVRTKPCT